MSGLTLIHTTCTFRVELFDEYMHAHQKLYFLDARLIGLQETELIIKRIQGMSRTFLERAEPQMLQNAIHYLCPLDTMHSGFYLTTLMCTLLHTTAIFK